jgi:hypothetical protein
MPHPPVRAAPSRVWIAVAGLTWLGAIGAGFDWLWRYEKRAGRASDAPSSWQGADDLALDRAHANVLVFAHPSCPCTRATLAELDRIAARCEGCARIVVSFTDRPELGLDLRESELWKLAAAIPGVEVRADPDAKLARRFRAATSGAVVVYAPDGRRVFEGGITGARGHQGDNAGADAVVDAAHGRSPAVSTTPVFGCSLGLAPSSPPADSRP